MNSKAVLEQSQKKWMLELWQSLTHSNFPPRVFSGGQNKPKFTSTFEFFSCVSGRVALNKIRCFPANKNASVSTGKEILPLRYSNLLNADFVSPHLVDNTMSNSCAQIACTNWVHLSVVLLQTCPVLSWKYKHLRTFYSSSSKSLIK